MLFPLIAGFAISAFVVYGLVHTAGQAVGIKELSWSGPLLVLLLAVLAAVEAAPAGIRRSLVQRQTPKMLLMRCPRPVAGLLWGLDTGTVVSTYRASMASWAALMLAMCATKGGAWLGLVYAAGFCVPLACIVLSWGSRRGPAWLSPQVETACLIEKAMRSVPVVRWVSTAAIAACAAAVAASSV